MMATTPTAMAREMVVLRETGAEADEVTDTVWEDASKHFPGQP
jgi:hypothetical protein